MDSPTTFRLAGRLARRRYDADRVEPRSPDSLDRSQHPPLRSAPLPPSSDWGSTYNGSRAPTPPPPYNAHHQWQSALGTPMPSAPKDTPSSDRMHQQYGNEGLTRRLIQKISAEFNLMAGHSDQADQGDFAVLRGVSQYPDDSSQPRDEAPVVIHFDVDLPSHERAQPTRHPVSQRALEPDMNKLLKPSPNSAPAPARPSAKQELSTPDSPTLGYQGLNKTEKPLPHPPLIDLEPDWDAGNYGSTQALGRGGLGSRRRAPKPLTLDETKALDSRLPRIRKRGEPETPHPQPTPKSPTVNEASKTPDTASSWYDHSEAESDAEPDFDHPPPAPKPPKSFTLQDGLRSACVAALTSLIVGGNWLTSHIQHERPLPAGHVRVRWTCKCGAALYDDFIEQQPGAARALERELNRHSSPSSPALPPPQHAAAPTSPADSASTPSSAADSIFSLSPSSTLSSASSASSLLSPPKPPGRAATLPSKGRAAAAATEHIVPLGLAAEPIWLLACVSEQRRAPKVTHIRADRSALRTDADLGAALAAAAAAPRPWFSLRGLRAVEFVMFEMHANRFADIRARPAVPPSPRAGTSSPSDVAGADGAGAAVDDGEYAFDATPLLPPVGSAYLLHLLAHPGDYAGERVAVARAPKRRGRLAAGPGWGVELVDGARPARVWAAVALAFALGSAAFAVAWAAREGRDVQGAFAVASWIVAFAGLVAGWLQAVAE